MSVSTPAELKLVRNHMLTFEPLAGGDTISDRLSVGVDSKPNRLYIVNVPDVTVYPYGILRFAGHPQSGEYRGNRKRVDAEVMLYDRPRARAELLETTADVFDQAMREWSDVANGLVFCREAQRDTLPPFQDPADREVVMIRLVYSVVFWPQFLTQYDT